MEIGGKSNSVRDRGYNCVRGDYTFWGNVGSEGYREIAWKGGANVRYLEQVSTWAVPYSSESQ
jgi:hypothetical protein